MSTTITSRLDDASDPGSAGAERSEPVGRAQRRAGAARVSAKQGGSPGRGVDGGAACRGTLASAVGVGDGSVAGVSAGLGGRAGRSHPNRPWPLGPSASAPVTIRNAILTGPGGREIMLEDPSGNPIELFQQAAPRQP
jgi:hypothetical protein